MPSTRICNRNTIKLSNMAANQCSLHGQSPIQEPKRPLIAIVTPIASITLVSLAWSSIIARLSSPMQPPTSSRTTCRGKPEGSPASDAIAGPLTSLTKRGKRMGSISSKCGTSRRSPDLSPSSPSPMAYGVQPNTISPCFINSNAMSRPRGMVRQAIGVVTPRRKRWGPSPRVLPRASPKAKRFKMSWNLSWPCWRIEADRAAVQGHGATWLGDVQAKGGEMCGLSLRQSYCFYWVSGTAQVEC
jgi:hypothetical protein